MQGAAMVNLELTNDERTILSEILDSELTELRGEICDTDRLSYREMLKEREQLIRRLMGKIQLLDQTPAPRPITQPA
jgi:hypothetical protein